MDSGFEMTTIYYLLIFIVGLLGYISSNIYTTKEFTDWYSKLNSSLPDLFNMSYGMYMSAFVYLAAGISLVILLDCFSENETKFLRSNVNTTASRPAIFSNITSGIEKIMLFIIPISFCLSFLINPLLRQTHTVIAPAVFSLLCLILFASIALYLIKYSWPGFFFMIPIIFWALYSTIFYFTLKETANVL